MTLGHVTIWKDMELSLEVSGVVKSTGVEEMRVWIVNGMGNPLGEITGILPDEVVDKLEAGLLEYLDGTELEIGYGDI